MMKNKKTKCNARMHQSVRVKAAQQTYSSMSVLQAVLLCIIHRAYSRNSTAN